ncbi:MAG: chemotaxis protein CheX [Magnetococcus sp. XQGC-1]
MSDNRRHTRVKPPIEVSVQCENGSVYRGTINDLSVSGVHIKLSSVFDLGPCLNGLVKMKLGADDAPYVAEFSGEIVRIEKDSVVCGMKGADPESFQQLKKVILEYANDPKKIIEEIKINQGVSLNNLYLPAMRGAIGYFLTDSVESVFGSFFQMDVVETDQWVHEGMTCTKVTGICGFNGALFGSVILIAYIDFARKFVSELLELDAPVESIPTVIDGFGELANMISGGVQTGLAEEYENISLIPPLVFFGDQCDYGGSHLYSVKKFYQCRLGSFSVDCLFSIV